MTQENFDKDIVSNSKFHMLRCVIAMAHQDGEVCDEERAYMTAMSRHLPLSDEQRGILMGDLDTAQDVADMFKNINEPKYRGQVCYFARLMAFKDGVLDPSEQELLDKLHSMATSGLDMDAIRADAQAAVGMRMAQHDINIDKFRPQGGLFGLFDQMLMAMGVDLMKD